MQSKKIFGGLQLMKATLSKKVNNLKSQYLFIYTSIPFEINLHLIMIKGAYLYLHIVYPMYGIHFSKIFRGITRFILKSEYLIMSWWPWKLRKNMFWYYLKRHERWNFIYWLCCAKAMYIWTITMKMKIVNICLKKTYSKSLNICLKTWMFS